MNLHRVLYEFNFFFFTNIDIKAIKHWYKQDARIVKVNVQFIILECVSFLFYKKVSKFCGLPYGTKQQVLNNLYRFTHLNPSSKHFLSLSLVVTAGNEDEFVDIEGDENMLQQYKQQQQQRQGFEELGFGEHESAGYMEGMENYQQHIYTGDFEHQEGFEGESLIYFTHAVSRFFFINLSSV